MTYIWEITPPCIPVPQDPNWIKHTRTSLYSSPAGAQLDAPCSAQHKLQQLLQANSLQRALESFSPAHTLLKVAHERGTASYLNIRGKKINSKQLAKEKTMAFCFGLLFFLKCMWSLFVYKNGEQKAMLINHNGSNHKLLPVKDRGSSVLFFNFFILSLKILHTFYHSLYVV